MQYIICHICWRHSHPDNILGMAFHETSQASFFWRFVAEYFHPNSQQKQSTWCVPFLRQKRFPKSLFNSSLFRRPRPQLLRPVSPWVRGQKTRRFRRLKGLCRSLGAKRGGHEEMKMGLRKSRWINDQLRNKGLTMRGLAANATEKSRVI